MKVFLPALFVFFCIPVFAQQSKIDSLLGVSENYPHTDSISVVQLINIFRQYSRQNEMEKVKLYGEQAIAMAMKLPSAYSLQNVYERLGRCYHGHSMFMEAINFYNKGIEVSRTLKDKRYEAGFYLNLSALYTSIPDYNKVLEASLMAVKLYNEIGDTDEIGGSYMNIGLTYNEIQQPVKAVEYMEKALAIFAGDNNGINFGSGLGYQGIANSYLVASDTELATLGIKPAQKYARAMLYFEKALKIGETDKESSTLISAVNTDIGKLYEKMGESEKALVCYHKALAANKNANDKEQEAEILFSLGNFYSGIKNFTQAKSYFFQSLAIGNSLQLLTVQRDALSELSKIYQSTGRYDSALSYYQRYITVRDTIFGEESKKEIARKQLQLDFTVKENEYKLTQQVSNAKLGQQQLQISFDQKVKLFLILAFALLISVSTWILYSRNKTRKLNRIISEQKAALEQLGQVKDKIFSVVSHDMRAPVNSLMSFIDILDNQEIPKDKLTLYAKELRKNLSYTSALMNNLLNWAGSQMQGFKPHKENFAANAVIGEVTEMLQHHLLEKQVTIKNEIPENVFFYTDRNMTSAILRNLVNNAVKFSPKGATVTISVSRISEGWLLAVTDEGSGMSSEALEQLNGNAYHPQESKRGTANEKGTGLGLLICKTFAAQMGGTIQGRNNLKGMTAELKIKN